MSNHVLNKAQTMMYLSLANLNRGQAASLAGVSRETFHRCLRDYRIQAPRSNAVLRPERVRGIRKRLARESRASIARSEGVHRDTINRLANFETWYWVK